MTRFPQKMKSAFLLTTFLSIASHLATAQTAPAVPMLHFNFNGGNSWPQAAADVMPSTPIDVLTSIETAPVGTMDGVNAAKPSGGLLIKTEVGEVGLPWLATYSSGLFLVRNTEINLSKLMLDLDLSASGARPVILRLESFNAKKFRTGGLETTLSPKNPDVYERHSVDLGAMTPNGSGKFNPVDPYIQITLELQNPAWPDKAAHELRIDNLRYTLAASDGDGKARKQ